MQLTGRTILVTGGSRGIGRAICLELAKRGASVAFSYRQDTQAADSLCKELEKLNARYLAYQADVSDSGQVRKMVSSVQNEIGQIYGLVNNAGIIKDGLFMMMSEKDWHDILNTNLTGTFYATKAVLTSMMKVKSGSVVNITSVAGTNGAPGLVNYSASKAGMVGFTKALAKEVARFNIRINALALGYFETDMTKTMNDKIREGALSHVPFNRFGNPEEAAKVTAFLLSDEASYITGTVLKVDGGLAI